MRFVTDGQILETVRQLAQHDGELLAAVAYWGKGAGHETGIRTREQPTRILCDLLSGSCNPEEIKILKSCRSVKIKHRDNLHAKVWTNGKETLVGSANASMNGLGFAQTGPNIEAAVHLLDAKIARRAKDWFNQQWEWAKCVDDTLLQAAMVRWNRKQHATNPAIPNAGGAIMNCRLTAYSTDELTCEARRRFDQIAPNLYPEAELGEIHARAERQRIHPADLNSYEYESGEMVPPVGTIYMDYSREGDNGEFEFGGFWEALHNEKLPAGGRTLCLLRRRDGRQFRVSDRYGGCDGIDIMVNCHMRIEQLDYLEQEFGAFLAVQEQRCCQGTEQQCDACPFGN